ncbi:MULTISPECIES: 3-hydroxyacyl-ACP dehydratase FabZ family protein [Chitinophagaceae]
MKDEIQIGRISPELILNNFPILSPFRFIDKIDQADAEQFSGSYTFHPEEPYFKGHFPASPVVPGSILQECAAQIGLVAFGMYLIGNNLASVIVNSASDIPEKLAAVPGFIIGKQEIRFFLTNTAMKFKRVVKPGETVIVHAGKDMFRFNKLKCGIKIVSTDHYLIAEGNMSGMIYVSPKHT